MLLRERRVVRYVQHLLHYGATTPAEVLVGLSSAIVGISVLVRPAAHLAVSGNHVLRTLCPYMWAWGLLYASVGCFRLLCLMAGQCVARKRAAFYSCVLWLFATMSIWFSGQFVAGLPAMALCGVATWVYWRLPCRLDGST